MSRKMSVSYEIVANAPKKNHNECLEEMFNIIEKYKLSFSELKPLFSMFFIDGILDFMAVLCYDMKNRFVTVGYISKYGRVGSSFVNLRLNVRLADGTYEPIILQQGGLNKHYWTEHFECVVGSYPDRMLTVLKKYVKKNRRTLLRKDKRAPITVREWEDALKRISELEEIVNRFTDCVSSNISI